MCVSPTKAKEDDVPPIGSDLPLIQDFMDGTMINMFVPAFDEATATQPEPTLATCLSSSCNYLSLKDTPKKGSNIICDDIVMGWSFGQFIGTVH